MPINTSSLVETLFRTTATAKGVNEIATRNDRDEINQLAAAEARAEEKLAKSSLENNIGSSGKPHRKKMVKANDPNRIDNIDTGLRRTVVGHQQNLFTGENDPVYAWTIVNIKNRVKQLTDRRKDLQDYYNMLRGTVDRYENIEKDTYKDLHSEVSKMLKDNPNWKPDYKKILDQAEADYGVDLSHLRSKYNSKENK